MAKLFKVHAANSRGSKSGFVSDKVQRKRWENEEITVSVMSTCVANTTPDTRW